jgi:hypothetical protein
VDRFTQQVGVAGACHTVGGGTSHGTPIGAPLRLTVNMLSSHTARCLSSTPRVNEDPNVNMKTGEV